MGKLYFVFNPHSGKAMIKNKLLYIVDRFVKAGYEVTIYPTQKPGDAYEKVIELEGQYDVIACSGGDGTFNEVIAGVLSYKDQEHKPAVGYIPSGTTNDFAVSLGIPKDMKLAADHMMDGHPFKCDIGSLNGRYFNYVAAFGIFTDVSYDTPQQLKNALGHQAYIIEGIKRLGQIKAYQMKVTCNGETVEGRFIYGMVSNSKSVGGIKGIGGKDVEFDDGLFEVALVKEPKNPFELQQAVSGILNQKKTTPMVKLFRSDKVLFESPDMVNWVVDGENGGEHERVEINVHHKVIELLVNKKENK